MKKPFTQNSLQARSTPIQICQYHQTAIIIRYITQNPILEAGIELKKIIHMLCRSDKYTFDKILHDWLDRWSDFLSEKSYNPITGKWRYTHRRIRSAYRSLTTNLPYLFTYLEHPNLGIPNTTNSLERSFSYLKTKVRVHAGLSQQRKIKIINQILMK